MRVSINNVHYLQRLEQKTKTTSFKKPNLRKICILKHLKRNKKKIKSLDFIIFNDATTRHHKNVYSSSTTRKKNKSNILNLDNLDSKFETSRTSTNDILPKSVQIFKIGKTTTNKNIGSLYFTFLLLLLFKATSISNLNIDQDEKNSSIATSLSLKDKTTKATTTTTKTIVYAYSNEFKNAKEFDFQFDSTDLDYYMQNYAGCTNKATTASCNQESTVNFDTDWLKKVIKNKISLFFSFFGELQCKLEFYYYGVK